MIHTSTATLKSTMETLVLRCQHTCTVVLPRGGAWRSSDVREALRSSSDSWSATVASSGDSVRCDKRLCFGSLLARRRTLPDPPGCQMGQDGRGHSAGEPPASRPEQEVTLAAISSSGSHPVSPSAREPRTHLGTEAWGVRPVRRPRVLSLLPAVALF